MSVPVCETGPVTTPAPASTPAPGTSRPSRTTPASRRTPAFVLAVVVVVAPVLAELARKWHSPWRPSGDDALFALHAHDVFTSHTPLLGTFSVVSEVMGKGTPSVYHLGPLVSWVLAVPERWFGARLGIAIGAALVNIVFLVAAVVMARRIAGDRAALGAAAVLACTAWSVGHTTLAEPWNPSIGLWALPLVFVAAVSFGSGRDTRSTLAVLVIASSFAVQAHYLFLGPVAAVVVVALLVRAAGRVRVPLRTVSWGVLAAVVCWAPTAIQQLTNDPGNLGAWIAVTRAATTKRAPFGEWPLRFVVNTIGAWPAFARGPLTTAQLIGLQRSPDLLTSVSCVVVVVVLLAGGVAAWRRHRVLAVYAFASLSTALGALYTISRYPVPVVSYPYYRIGMLWLAGAAVWSACGAVVWAAIRDRGVPSERVQSLVLVAGVVVALVVGTAASIGGSPAGPVSRLEARAVDRLSAVALERLDRAQAYVVQGRGIVGAFAGYGVFRELDRAGFEVYVPESDVQLRSRSGVGRRRLPMLVVVSGPAKLRPGTEVLARFDDGADPQRHFVLAIEPAPSA